MCGIAGVRSFTGHTPTGYTLTAMADTLVHRGPDASGYWVGEGIGLAHRRLSIIDLEGSPQPMASPDGRWHLVFNGEIFNYRELRSRFAGAFDYRTDGDGEAILAGLVRHGIGVVEHLLGQFAFVAYDSATGDTYLVRDRLGVLPLFYRLDGRELVFGSEIKAVLAGSGGAPEVDLASLGAYLRGRSVPAPHTLVQGVRKLPAGHVLRVDRDGRSELTRYWAPPAPDAEGTWTPDAAVDAVAEAVREAVSSALVADVPVGAYLSGGIDSSLITAVMSDLRAGAGVETFSAGFGDPRHDELPWARRVSDLLGTTHHEVLVRPADFEAHWRRLTWHRDAPMSEPADVAVFQLARLARERVKVVLSGEGGDELFAGYPKYTMTRMMQATRFVPGGLRAAVVGALDPRLPSRAARARIALRVAGARTEAEQLAQWFAPFSARERALLLGGLEQHEDVPAADVPRDLVGRMLAADLRSWLPDNLLERGDRMSMATSLELRPPLLDHRLVDLAFRLPSSVKVRDGVTKWALKQVARRYLPDEVVDRRKVGFRVPLDSWFRSGLRDSMWDRLTGPRSFVATALDRDAVVRLLERHESGTFNEEARIWTLMSLEVWHEMLMELPAPAPTHAPTVLSAALAADIDEALSPALHPDLGPDLALDPALADLPVPTSPAGLGELEYTAPREPSAAELPEPSVPPEPSVLPEAADAPGAEDAVAPGDLAPESGR